MDTSFIVPLYTLEATSGDVEAFLRGQPPGSLTVSHWSRVEFASMLARNVRMNLQAEAHARELMRRFDEDMETTFHMYAPSLTDFDLAATLILDVPTLGLRGPDALHLAAVKNERLPLYTLDKTFLRAAQALGVPATDAGIGTQ